MARVIITKALDKEMNKRLSKHQYYQAKDTFEELETQPHKGKHLRTIGRVFIKELRIGTFRFYFLTTHEHIPSQHIKFVAMSKKKDQQSTIENIIASLTENTH